MEFNRTKLMWASFLTLVASGVGFATRAAAGGVWESEFGIDGGQFGNIMGAGFLGFGLMIFFGGVLVEKFGYKLLLMIAFLMHLASAGMLLVAPSMFAGWREADAATATANVYSLLWYSALLVFDLPRSVRSSDQSSDCSDISRKQDALPKHSPRRLARRHDHRRAVRRWIHWKRTLVCLDPLAIRLVHICRFRACLWSPLLYGEIPENRIGRNI